MIAKYKQQVDTNNHGDYLGITLSLSLSLFHTNSQFLIMIMISRALSFFSYVFVFYAVLKREREREKVNNFIWISSIQIETPCLHNKCIINDHISYGCYFVFLAFLTDTLRMYLRYQNLGIN